MGTSRQLSRPPDGRPAQHSCSRSKRTPTQPSRFDLKANSGNRSTLFPAKVATEAGVSQQGFDLDSLLNNVFALKPANLKLNPSQFQSFIERAVVDCRFFTLVAVAGSLLGSILCFVEGFIMVLRSYFRYFEAVVHKLDHASTVELLVEAIYVFLVGTALLIFGMGLYVMFFGSQHLNHQRQKTRKLSKSNMSSFFYLEFQSWLQMVLLSEAKTRIGHAVLKILQVGMLDKFKSAPLVTGADLESFAAATLLLSASIFCLSKLSRSGVQGG